MVVAPKLPVLVPPGWKLVNENDGYTADKKWRLLPVEPTEEMVDAFSYAGADAREAARENNRKLGRHHPNAVADCEWIPQAYRAMLTAAPLPSSPDVPNG